MNRRSFLISSLLATTAQALRINSANAADKPSITRLSSLQPRLVNQGWGSLLFDKSVDNKPLQIGNRRFEHGVSTHSRSDLVYLVANRFSKLQAWVGVDAANTKPKDGTAIFQIFADGKKLFDSGLMKADTPAARVDVDLTNVNVLRLIVTYEGAYADHVDWAEAELTSNPAYAALTSTGAKAPLQKIRSGDLLFTAGGSSLSGLQLANGKRINLQGAFGLGPYYKASNSADSIDISAKFASAAGGLGWDWSCLSKSSKPWTAPVDTTFKWPDAVNAKVWLARGFGRLWKDPLVALPFEDKTFEYGAFFNREDGLSLPMATVIDEKAGVGVSFIQSPDDTLLDMQISTTKNGEIHFSRAFHRFGGESSKVGFHMDIVVHEPDFRSALQAIVERYPKYFDTKPLAQEVGGGGAYSGWEGALDTDRLKAMSFSMNWKASIDFPYMGVFLPPVANDVKWNRFAGGGEGNSTASDEGRYGQTSIDELSKYSTDMKQQGFHVLNYFNVTEFGSNIVYPAPSRKTQNDADLWKDPNDLLHSKFENAVLKTPKPLFTWGNGVIMDCGDPAYKAFLIEQAQRHIDKLPDSSGICIDRMDWLTRYNPNADDDVTWIDGPQRHLRRSWIALMKDLGATMHDGGKVIFGNDMDRRLELMENVDGFYDEHGDYPFNINTSAFLALRKPLVCWTRDEDAFIPNPDECLQRHLYLGAFPTVPVKGNDHTILPTQGFDQFYLDYGPLFNAIKGRTWVLKPGVVQVKGDTAKANVFETSSGYVAFVGLGGAAQQAEVTLKGLGNKAKVMHPGDKDTADLQATSGSPAAKFDVPLKRGCAMLLISKA